MKKIQAKLKSFNKTFTRKEKIVIALHILKYIVGGCLAVYVGWKAIEWGVSLILIGLEKFLWSMFHIRLY